MDEKNQYFSGKHERLMPFLHVQKLCVNYDKKGFSCERLSDALSLLSAEKYYAAVWLVNEFKLGYYESGKFIFADGGLVEEKFLLELRVFNDYQELHVVRKGTALHASIITENKQGDTIAVDSSSQIFGERVEADVPDRFVRLEEPGRKIAFTIPVDKKADKYYLRTRSYVEQNEKTGQAGFGFSRWVGIYEEGAVYDGF